MMIQTRTLRLLTAPFAVSLLVACTTPSEDQPLKTTSNTYVDYAEGVPGGALTETEELVATIVSIDKKKRTFVVKDEEGHKRTIQAPPEMKNFDQLAVGDKVRAMIAVETLVYVQEPGQGVPDSVTTVAGVAAPGQKPGAAVLEQVTIKALIFAVNINRHTATLQFEDGTQREVKVRPDVEVSSDYVGKEVMIVITAALATAVEKQ